MEHSDPRPANTSVRKRALNACELCRAKKTKCDNTRPSCESCVKLGAKCLYKASNIDPSPLDATNQAVLERLDYLVQLVETQNERQLFHSPHQAVINQTPNSIFSVDPLHPSPSAVDASRISAQPSPGDTTSSSEPVDLACQSYGACETLLKWPVFGNEFPTSGPDLIVFQTEVTEKLEEKSCLSPSSNVHGTHFAASRRSIHEKDALYLAHKFLTHVHIKNPILEENNLFDIAREVMEHGFGWDERSCLMLIVCALGSLCSEFIEDFIKPCQVVGSTPISSVADAIDYVASETSYIASRKRVGLLGNSVVATECHFYSGIYEMFSLRPLRAWSSFNQASKTLQLYLKAQSSHTADAACSLIRSLYWSCLKSKWEIRMEIDVPPSGLATLNYGEIFPLPPASSPQPQGEQYRAVEKSWNFYLSELAVRRIANRLMSCFYQHDETWWLSVPIERLIRIATEIQLQLTQWTNHLPQVGHCAKAFSDLARSDELTFYLHGRLLGFTERVYRPFLYLALYHPHDTPVQESLAPSVQKHIDTCLTHTLRGIRRHRHHGTWFQIRECVSMSFLLLAAVKSRNVQVADSWRDAVETTIAGCMFWELEAPDCVYFDAS